SASQPTELVREPIQRLKTQEPRMTVAAPRYKILANMFKPAIMSSPFDQTDFSVVVKHRAALPKQWRWEIYRAGRRSPIERSSVRYETVSAAKRAGREALKHLLTWGKADIVRRPNCKPRAAGVDPAHHSASRR